MKRNCTTKMYLRNKISIFFESFKAQSRKVKEKKGIPACLSLDGVIEMIDNNNSSQKTLCNYTVPMKTAKRASLYTSAQPIHRSNSRMS